MQAVEILLRQTMAHCQIPHNPVCHDIQMSPSGLKWLVGKLLFHFCEIGAVVYYHDKVVAINWEEICGYFIPWSLWDLMCQKGFFGLWWLYSIANRTVTDIIFDFWAHQWPVEHFPGSPKAGLYSQVAFMNLQEHILSKSCRKDNSAAFKHYVILYRQFVLALKVGTSFWWSGGVANLK